MSDGASSSRRGQDQVVAVVGGGVAATAAALVAAASGARVLVFKGGSGATALSSGALDDVPWEESGGRARTLDAVESQVLEQLEIYSLPAEGSVVVTLAGLVRPARGADRALLDLGPARPGVVLVPRSDHHGWDATALARAWTDSALARERGLTFRAEDVQLTRLREERPLRDAEIAARHDEAARLAWLAVRLREATASATYVAIALPAWLGIDRPRARALSERVGLPCGEVVAGLAGPAGARFLRARDRALASANVEVFSAWAARIEKDAERWVVTLEDAQSVPADSVILAAGGLVGGGLAYQPSGAMLATALPPFSRATFRTTLDVPATVGFEGHPLDLPGSLFGAAPESLAWPFTTTPMLERVGVLVDGRMRVVGAPPGLFACGDIVADRPRTWLDALAAGVHAGASALAALR